MSDYIVNPIKKVLNVRIYLPKKLVIFSGAPVKKNTLYLAVLKFVIAGGSRMKGKKNGGGGGSLVGGFWK